MAAGSIPNASEATTTTVTLGFYASQQFAFKDRLYLTAEVRSDRNSAFGNLYDRVYYPKFAASYVISDEAFFPKSGTLSPASGCGAPGAASGRQPGANDALLFFSPLTTNVDQAGHARAWS